MGDNNIFKFLCYWLDKKNATLKNCILCNLFYSYLLSFVIHRLLYWFESFVTRPEMELISQLLLVQISSTKF